MKKTNSMSSVTLLRERIEENYEDFKAGMLELDNKTLFELAPTIAAARDVYRYTIKGGCLAETEAEYLLRFDNPFKVLTDAWAQYSDSGECDMYDLIGSFVEDEDGEVFLADDLADELREKHGDVPLETAITFELINLVELLFKEVCRRYFEGG